MTRFADFAAADRRLVILLALSSSAGYTASLTLLQAFMGTKGQHAPAHQVRGDLAWLDEQGLVTRQGEDVATLTERGLDVAGDRAECPGVARPRPGDL